MNNLYTKSLESFLNVATIVTMVVLFLAVTNLNAQNEQLKKTTTIYTLNVETMEGHTVPYKIKISETSKSIIRFAEEDDGKTNKTQMYIPDYVTKLIFVDKDADNDYDGYIVLKYIKDTNDSFKLKPTKRGFSVEVDKKHVEYIFGEGVYFVNSKDADWFFVEEFDML